MIEKHVMLQFTFSANVLRIFTHMLLTQLIDPVKISELIVKTKEKVTVVSIFVD